MKPVNLVRYKRSTPSSIPPAGQVDLKFDPATNTFVQVNSDGTTSELGGGGAADTGLATVETETGTSYTLVASDSGKVIYFTSGSSITLAVEAELPVGFNVAVFQGGAGIITFNPGAGIEINGDVSNHETTGQWSAASLLILATGVAALKGDVISLA